MSWLKDIKIFIALIYINILFILTIVKVCYKIENFSYLFITGLFVSAVLFYWFFHSVLRRKSLKIFFAFILLGGLAALFIMKATYLNNMFITHIVNNFNYINSLVARSMPTEFGQYKPIFIIVLPLLVLIILIFTTRGAANSILILNLILIIAFWYLGYTDEVKRYLFQYVLVTLVTYCMNSYIKNIGKLSKKGIKIGIDSKKIFVYAIITSLVIAGISSVLPQEYNGQYASEIESKIRNKFMKTGETGEVKGKKYKYDLTFSGYDNNKKKLGGPITINKLVAFRVKSDQTYYLKGNVKDYYDGFMWDQSEQNYTPKSDKINSMLLERFSTIFRDKSSTITIYPEELNSSTIFSPNLAYDAMLEKGSIFYDDIPTFVNGGIIDKPYSVYFYDLNSRGQDILKNGSRQKLTDVGAAYYAENYKKYLQLPNNISPRVYDLVYSLTKNAKNNIEKVQNIRDYLNKNYSYTLKVSEVPEGQEFVDYFLFTEKKGYCTYFATAETIMCRIAGIPARYVEGFNMIEDKDQNGLYVVKNENAHAWTEVLYLSSPNEGLWYTVDAVPNAVESIHKEEEEEKAKLEKTPGVDPGQVVIPPKRSPSNNNGVDSQNGSGKIKLSPIVIRLLGTFIVIFLFHAFVFAVFFIRKRAVVNKDSVIPIYKYSLNRLETIGRKKSEFIPDMEFIEKLDEELSQKLKEAASLAYSEYYGSKGPQIFNKKNYYDFIETYIRNRDTRFNYFIKKYYFYKEISFIKSKVVLLYKRIRSI